MVDISSLLMSVEINLIFVESKELKMLYEFECEKCKTRKEVSAKLKECDSLIIVCDNPKCKNNGKPMQRMLSATPKHTSWSNW